MYSLPWPKGKPGENKGVRGFDEPNANAIDKMTMYGRRLGRPQVPVAEGGPVGFSDGGNRRDWFPGGCGRPKRRLNGDVILINVLILE
jgi:hypothetical protein